MNDLKTNIGNLDSAKDRLTDHPLCLSYETSPGYLFVKFPEGDFEVEGIQVRGYSSQSSAIDKAISIMEGIWQRSYPGNRSEDIAEQHKVLSDLAFGFSCMTHGPQSEQFHTKGMEHLKAALDAKYGPVSPEILSMSDDELLAELES